MVNLLSNAIKYARPNTEVKINVQTRPSRAVIVDALSAGTSDLKFCSPDAVTEYLNNANHNVTVISVHDQGHGIPENEMGNLFEKFEQLKISKEMDRKYAAGGTHTVGQSCGSGLGLNLVLKFVKLVSLKVSYNFLDLWLLVLVAHINSLSSKPFVQ